MILIIIFSVITMTASRPSLPDLTDDNFQSECLDAQNVFRALHNAQLLQTDPTIVAYAKTRCQAISKFTRLEEGHSGLVGYGENYFWSGLPLTCTIVVGLWYEEIINYDFSNPGYVQSAGEFTQLVWNSTTKVGCAICGKTLSETYVVCDYSVAGNVIGLFEQNVLPPLGIGGEIDE